MEHILQPGQAAAHAQSRRMQHPQVASPTVAAYPHPQHSYTQTDASNQHQQQYFNPATMMYGSPNVYPAAYTQSSVHQGYAPAAYNYAAHNAHMAQHSTPHHYVQSFATPHQYATPHAQSHTYGNYTQVTPAMTPMQAAAAQSQANVPTLAPPHHHQQQLQQSPAGPSRTKATKKEAPDVKPSRPGPYDMSYVAGVEAIAPAALPKKSRKERDSNKPTTLKSHLKPPKQAPSAWQVYFTEELKKMKEMDSGQRLNVAHVAKDAGARYAALPEDQKQEFKAKSLQLKAEWEREMEEWRQTLTPDDIKQENAFRTAQRKAGKSRKGNLKDPHAPKKPLSAYFLFLRAIRADAVMMASVFQGETETTKQSVLAAAKWRALSEQEKQPYLDKAETDKAEYERQRRDYELQNGLEPTIPKPKARGTPSAGLSAPPTMPTTTTTTTTTMPDASASSPPKREESTRGVSEEPLDVEGLEAHTVHPDDFKIEGFTDDFHAGADHL